MSPSRPHHANGGAVHQHGGDCRIDGAYFTGVDAGEPTTTHAHKSRCQANRRLLGSQRAVPGVEDKCHDAGLSLGQINQHPDDDGAALLRHRLCRLDLVDQPLHARQQMLWRKSVPEMSTMISGRNQRSFHYGHLAVDVNRHGRTVKLRRYG